MAHIVECVELDLGLWTGIFLSMKWRSQRFCPPPTQTFARPVKESLVVFLSGLPPAIQKSIMTEQATLPATATLSERLGLLARGCPVLHKLGQVLARDQRLAEELRRELRPLESLPPSTNFETMRAVLAEELGPLESRAITLLAAGNCRSQRGSGHSISRHSE